MPVRNVEIIVTNTIVAHYEARSYPHVEVDASDHCYLYRVPVYTVTVRGFDDAGIARSYDYMAPRFMPYYNNPKRPTHYYRNTGWVNSGLFETRRVAVPLYKRDYSIQNSYSPGIGAIVVHNTFYIHAEPC